MQPPRLRCPRALSPCKASAELLGWILVTTPGLYQVVGLFTQNPLATRPKLVQSYFSPWVLWSLGQGIWKPEHCHWATATADLGGKSSNSGWASPRCASFFSFWVYVAQFLVLLSKLCCFCSLSVCLDVSYHPFCLPLKASGSWKSAETWCWASGNINTFQFKYSFSSEPRRSEALSQLELSLSLHIPGPLFSCSPNAPFGQSPHLLRVLPSPSFLGTGQANDFLEQPLTF